jgi:hypothetical protein
MDFVVYAKEKYMKMALKGIKLPFSQKWESALVAAQCIFAINLKLNQNSVMLLQNIQEEKFMEDFSNGVKIEYNDKSQKYVESFLRVQNLLIVINRLTTPNIPKISEIVLANKDSIDEAIYKYYIGNKSVAERYAQVGLEQALAIDNSLKTSFPDNQQEISTIRNQLQELFDRTNRETSDLVKKFSDALEISDIVKYRV